MVLFGIGHGVMPMVGFNEGAKLYGRLTETVNVGVKLSVIFSITVFLIYELFAHHLLMLFTNDPDLLTIAVPAVRIFVTMLLLIGPNLVWINMFIGLGKGLTSMCLLLMRDLLLLIPMLFLLPAWFGLNGVWMAQPLSNLFAFFIIFYWKSREFAIIMKKT
jgi:Na+-driven multidrug efflux pump